MKKILIVGGSHSEIPLVLAAKELGLYVITTGNQKNGLGHRYSNEFHLVDYSDKEAVYQLAKKLDVDHLCFGAHDLSMLSTAYTAEKLGFTHFDDLKTTEILHHKDKFKAFASHYNILTPKAETFSSLHTAIEFAKSSKLPFIVKPTDMGGGKGISVIDDITSIESAIKSAFNYSKVNKIVIEEYFNGTLHSFSTFIQDQRVAFYYADDEYPCPLNPYGVCTSTSPATNFDVVKSKLIEQTEKIAQRLQLKDGLLHMQYLQNKNEIMIIEFTRRMPGDMYNIPVEYSTGIEYSKNIIRFCCNQNIKIRQLVQKKFVSRHCIVADTSTKIDFSKELESNIIDKLLWYDEQNIEKKGIVFLKYGSHHEMIEKNVQLVDLIKVKP